jgi:hypothetical protein
MTVKLTTTLRNLEKTIYKADTRKEIMYIHIELYNQFDIVR